ncbi:HAAS signaling domain-containing protein [Microbacterium sp. LWH12-1.2]|uniref:HAAS signaling domain-containing protein n=1 Tax=Microbacterium sp. LWH12-1.2 TaxID=3135259 RepID=UPI00341FA938
MSENEAARQREEFLARLDAAMRDVPHGVAMDIRRGILDELEGLDADATAERIARLGDPMLIAREARMGGADAAAPAPVVVAAESREPMTQTRGFAIIAALSLGFGGFLIPVVGWVIGAVLVGLSPLWRRGEKVVALVAPFVVVGLSALIISLLSGFGSSGSTSDAAGALATPAANNPLVPTGYDLWHSGFLFAFLLLPASGLWLLWRLRGRAAR